MFKGETMKRRLGSVQSSHINQQQNFLMQQLHLLKVRKEFNTSLTFGHHKFHLGKIYRMVHLPDIETEGTVERKQGFKD
jgi:hypothetical protein